MALPLSWTDVQINDYGEEPTIVRLPITTLTPSNVAATETLVGNLRTAIAAMTLGLFVKNSITYAVNQTGAGPASDPLAQRENKWLVRYHDGTTQQKYRAELGTADLSLLADHSEFLSLTSAEGAAFKTAFEAVVVSPGNSSNSVVVDSIQFVGRNS